MMYLLIHLLRALDAEERRYWRRIEVILAGLGPVDPRRFMYGRD
jgi:hypothetical protein